VLQNIIHTSDTSHFSNLIQFYQRCFSLTANPIIYRLILDKFTVTYVPHDLTDELELIVKLFKQFPGDPSIVEAFRKAFVFSENVHLDVKHKKFIVHILSSVLSETPFPLNPELIQYVSSFLPYGTSSEKKNLVMALIEVPQPHQHPYCLINILQCVKNLKSIKLKKILRRVEWYRSTYDGKLTDDMGMLFFLLAELHLSAGSLGQCSEKLHICLFYLNLIEKQKRKHVPFKIQNLTLLVEQFFKVVSSDDLHIEPPERSRLLMTVAEKINPTHFHTPKKLIPIVGALQKCCHHESIETQILFIDKIIEGDSIKRGGNLPKQLTTIIQTIIDDEIDKKVLYPLARHANLMLYLKSSQKVIHFVFHTLIFSFHRETIITVPRHLETLFGKKVDDKRIDWYDATMLQIAELDKKESIAQSCIELYISRELKNSDPIITTALRTAAFPYITRTLFRESDYDLYRQIVHKLLDKDFIMEEHYTKCLFCLVHQLVFDPNVGKFAFNADSSNKDIIIFLADQLYNELSLNPYDNKDDYELIIDFAILLICSCDLEMIARFNLSRFIDLISSQLSRADSTVKKLAFLYMHFADTRSTIVERPDEDYFELIFKFVNVPLETGLPLAILLFDKATRRIKKENPDLYHEKGIKLLETHMSMQENFALIPKPDQLEAHIEAYVSNSCLLLNRFDWMNSFLLDTIYDILKEQKNPHPFYIDYFGGLLSFVINEDPYRDLFFRNLGRYPTLKGASPLTFQVEELVTRVCLFITQKESIEQKHLYQVLKFLDLLLQSEKESSEFDQYIEKIVLSLRERIHTSDLEYGLAPYICYLFNTEQLIEQKVTFDIPRQQQILLTKLATSYTTFSTRSFVMIHMLLSDFITHAEMNSSEASHHHFLKNYLSLLSCSLASSPSIEDPYPLDEYTYAIKSIIEEPVTSYCAISHAEILEAMTSLIHLEVSRDDKNPQLLVKQIQTFLMILFDYQAHIPPDDYDAFFNFSESIYKIINDQEIRFSKLKKRQTYADFSRASFFLIEFIIEPRNRLDKDALYYKKLYATLTRIIRLMSHRAGDSREIAQKRMEVFKLKMVECIPELFQTEDAHPLIEAIKLLEDKDS